MTKCLVVSLLALLASAPWTAEAPKEKGGGFTALFDGKTLDGWHTANEPGHGGGGVWRVKDGAIDGVQEWPGAWAMVATSKEFGDFELLLEVKAESPVDSGALLRTTMEGHGYQVLIHSRPDGDVGGIAAAKIGDFSAPAKDWNKSWKEGDWNEIRIACKGSPPEIHTWLNGTPMADLKVVAKDPRVGASGHVGFKIHGAEDCFNNHVRFRNIRILELK